MDNQTSKPRNFEQLVRECVKEVISETESGEELPKGSLEDIAYAKMRSRLSSLGFAYDPDIFNTTVEKETKKALQKEILVFRKK